MRLSQIWETVALGHRVFLEVVQAKIHLSDGVVDERADLQIDNLAAEAAVVS
jgi:hypothetical protein